MVSLRGFTYFPAIASMWSTPSRPGYGKKAFEVIETLS